MSTGPTKYRMRFHEFAFPLDEAFTDLEKLSPAELTKGQPLDPSDRGNFRRVDARVFHRTLTHLQSNDLAKLDAGVPSKGLNTLTAYSVDEYRKMACFIGINNSSGFAVTRSGELVSVFSSQRSSGAAIVTAAVENGARHLDCFCLRQGGRIEGALFRLYSRAGFKIDRDRNEGVPGEPMSIVRGISDFVDERGVVHPDDPRVVVFMRR